MSKKFSFEDLQPHVDMLCDALENKGASASGLPYNKEVYPYAAKYKELLSDIRAKVISKESLTEKLIEYKFAVISAAAVNQAYRIRNLAEALHIYMLKEFDKVNSNE